MPQEILCPEQKREEIMGILGGKHIRDVAKNKDVACLNGELRWGHIGWGSSYRQFSDSRDWVSGSPEGALYRRHLHRAGLNYIVN